MKPNTNKSRKTYIGQFLLIIMLVMLPIWQANAQKISLNLNNVDIVDILKTISEQSKYNIAIGAGVSGKVTVYLDSVEVLDAIEIITELAGVAYFLEDNTIKIISRNQYQEMYGRQPFDKRSLRIFEMEAAFPANLVNELNKIKSPKGVILYDTYSNKLYVLENPEELRLMQTIISNSDIEHGFRVYNLKYVTPDALQNVVKGFLTQSAIITPDPTNNRLILIDRSENLALLDEFVENYDSPSLLQTSNFKLQYGSVTDILPQIQTLLTPNIGRVVTDVVNNQISVTDLPEKVEQISQVITSFDIKTSEVYIEAKIVQVSLTDNLKLGVNWKALTESIEELRTVNATADFNILSSSDQGLRFTSGLLSEKNYEFVLEALSEVGQTDLLSSPHITAVNNKEARILVGSSIPYKTIDTREENGTIRTFEKVTMVEVGVKLYVTPTINDSAFVKLKIRPEVSSVTSFSDGIPVVEKTEAETEVLVKDGVTLIIGGLIKNETRKNVKKIPLLGDIPLLGMLFSSTDNQLVKSEFIIFITPHIITGEATQEAIK